MPVAFASNYIYQTIMDQTISTSTAATVVNVAGYSSYALLARFEGPAGSQFRMEINNESLLVQQENLTIEAGGWLNFYRIYPVYGPRIGVVIYHPPANLKVRMTVYAAH